MKMSEYVRGEWKKLKDQPFKVRLAYFWDYYKWHTIIAVLVVALLTSTVGTQLNKKDTVLSGILINGSQPLDDPALLQEFYAQSGINPDQQEMLLHTGFVLTETDPSVSMLTYQRIHAGVAAGDTDFIVGNADAIRRCGYDTSHMLADLRAYLSSEELAQLEGKLYYLDGSVWKAENYGTGEELVFPSPFTPEEMKDPIPVGIDISACTEFLSAYYGANEKIYFTIVSNAPHMELTLQWLDFLQTYEE